MPASERGAEGEIEGQKIIKSQIEDIINFSLKELGSNAVAFQPCDIHQPEFQQYDIYNDMKSVEKCINIIIKYKKMGYPILNTYKYLDMVKKKKFRYYCNPDNCIQINENGFVVFPCIRIKDENIDVKTSSLKEIWFNNQKIRNKYKKCNRCQFHCIVENNLVFPNFLRPTSIHVLKDWYGMKTAAFSWKWKK